MNNRARFNGAFKLSELIALDTAHPDECAVLIMRPSAFAVLNWLAEIVFWTHFIEDDVSVTEWDRTGDQYKWRIFSEMAYSYGLTEYMERMADAQERIAANLEADTGEGIAGIASILFDLLPVLLAGNTTSSELASSVDDIYNFLSGDNPALQTAHIQELVNAMQLQASGGCCEPNPTQNGMVLLPPGCVNYGEYASIFGSSNMATPVLRANGSVEIESLSTNGVVTFEYPETNGDLIFKYDFNLLNNDSGGLVLQVKPSSGAGWSQVLDVSTYGSGVFTVSDYQVPLLLRITVEGDGDIWSLDGGICQTITDYSKPTVILDTANGIGTIEGGGLIKSAGEWVTDAFDPAVIRADINSAVESVQIDWTRVFSGTVTVDVLENDLVVESYEFDASLQRKTVVDFVEDGWDTLKVTIASAFAQTLADVVVWAFGD